MECSYRSVVLIGPSLEVTTISPLTFCIAQRRFNASPGSFQLRSTWSRSLTTATKQVFAGGVLDADEAVVVVVVLTRQTGRVGDAEPQLPRVRGGLVEGRRRAADPRPSAVHAVPEAGFDPVEEAAAFLGASAHDQRVLCGAAAGRTARRARARARGRGPPASSVAAPCRSLSFSVALAVHSVPSAVLRLKSPMVISLPARFSRMFWPRRFPSW